MGSIYGLHAQRLLKGKVLNTDQTPIEGVHIYNDTQLLTITDPHGYFVIKKPNIKTLTLSHIAYKTTTVRADYLSPIRIELVKNAIQIKELKIVGQWAEAHQGVTHTDLSKDELAKRDFGQDMPSQLKGTTSVVMHSDAGAGIGYSYMRVRGTDQERIGVNINGVPLNDAESQQVFWVDLPDFASSAGSVQIQRGLGLSSHGAGAFGASLHINTQYIDTEPSLSLHTGYGTFRTFQSRIKASTGLLHQKYYLQGRASFIRSDGFVDRASSDLKSFYLTTGFLSKKQSLGLHLFSGHEITYQAWNGIPYPFSLIDSLRSYNAAGTEKPGTPYEDEVDNYKQTHLQLIYKNSLSADWALHVTGHYTKGLGFFELYKANKNLADFEINLPLNPIGDLVQRRWLDNHFFGVIGTLQFESTDIRNKVTLGSAFNRYLGDHFGQIIWTSKTNDLVTPVTYYNNSGQKFDFNSYLQWNYQWSGQLHTYLDIQYRYVDYRYEGPNEQNDLLNQRVQHHFINPKAGFSYRLNQHLKTYGYIGYGHKEPNRNDYVDSSPISRPRAEKMLNVEMGIEAVKNYWRLKTNLYWMQYTDQLIPTGRLNDVGATTRVNVPDSYRKGIELELAYNPSRVIAWRANVTLSKNKIEAFNFYVDQFDEAYAYIGQKKYRLKNTDLALSPSVIMMSGLQIKPHKSWIFLLDANYVHRQYLDNTQNKAVSLDPYWTTDFMIHFQPHSKNRGLKLSVGCFNLFDYSYESFGWAYAYDGPGFGTDYTYSLSDHQHREIGLYPQAGQHFLTSITYTF